MVSKKFRKPLLDVTHFLGGRSVQHSFHHLPNIRSNPLSTPILQDI
jgi:hypothetical protein